MLDNNKPVDVVYLDQEKAFDKIPHRRLLMKVKGYGIHGKLVWIEDFLSDRTQYVIVGDGCSKDVLMTSDVPQGTVLGPLLFVYVNNDMPDILECFSKLSADDTI